MLDFIILIAGTGMGYLLAGSLLFHMRSYIMHSLGDTSPRDEEHWSDALSISGFLLLIVTGIGWTHLGTMRPGTTRHPKGALWILLFSLAAGLLLVAFLLSLPLHVMPDGVFGLFFERMVRAVLGIVLFFFLPLPPSLLLSALGYAPSKAMSFITFLILIGLHIMTGALVLGGLLAPVTDGIFLLLHFAAL